MSVILKLLFFFSLRDTTLSFIPNEESGIKERDLLFKLKSDSLGMKLKKMSNSLVVFLTLISSVKGKLSPVS